MVRDELLAVLRLQNIPNIGDVTAKKLIAHCGSPSAIFRDRKQRLQKIDGVGSRVLYHLFDKAHLEAAERELGYIEEHNIDYNYFMDRDYPAYLKHCLDSPILLFKKGKIDFEGRKVISVVGTRNITGYGMSFCESFIEEIAPLDPVIVSGFAYGVDICIQKAAIKHGLQTIGCLAHGLNQIYPKAHSVYGAEVERNGGFLTEYWSTSNPERENFRRRNRVIAGISEATIVIESAEKGGSLVTAELANGYNRDVVAVPGRVNDKYNTGCHNLIKQQRANLLTSASDLIYMLGWELEQQQQQPVQKQLFVEMDVTDKVIYDHLQKKGRQLLDSIALDCILPIFKVSSILLNMEMKG